MVVSYADVAIIITENFKDTVFERMQRFKVARDVDNKLTLKIWNI